MAADGASWEDIQINGSLTNGPASKVLMGFYHLLPASSTCSQSLHKDKLCRLTLRTHWAELHLKSPPPPLHPPSRHTLKFIDRTMDIATLSPTFRYHFAFILNAVAHRKLKNTSPKWSHPELKTWKLVDDTSLNIITDKNVIYGCHEN